MKAILEFDLPEEKWELETALHGASYRILLSDLDNEARSALKYGHEHGSVESVFEWLRQYLRDGAPDIFDM